MASSDLFRMVSLKHLKASLGDATQRLQASAKVT